MNLLPKEIRNMTGQARAKSPRLRNAFTAIATVLVLALISNPAVVLAEQSAYSVESLEGDYAFVGTYSGDVARLVGTAEFDGRGDLTSGSARVVIVGGAVKSISYSGQYTMNPDGTGTMTLSIFGVATPPPTVTLDFVISKARILNNGIKIATEIQDALEGPSVVVPGQNSFVTHIFTRRSDREHRR